MPVEKKAVIRVKFNPYYTNSMELPITIFDEIKIIESCNMFLPTMELSFRDPVAAYFDEAGTAFVRVGLSATEDDPGLVGDWAILSMKESSPPYAKEPWNQPRRFTAVPVYGIPFLIWARRYSYGEDTSSEVFRKLVEFILEKLDMYPVFSDDTFEATADKAIYIQPGWPPLKFIWYLADKAFNYKGHGGFMAWTDLVRLPVDFDGAEINPPRVNFCTPSYLIRNSTKHEFVITYDPKVISEAENNNGISSDGKRVGFGFSMMYTEAFNVYDYGRTVSVYSLKDKKAIEAYYAYDDFSFEHLQPDKKTYRYYDPLYDSIITKRYKPNLYEYGGHISLEWSNLGFDFETKALASRSPHRSFMKRCVSILTYASPEIQVGQKVSLEFPLSISGKQRFYAVDGDWLITKIIHFAKAPGQKYIMKLVLSRDEYLGDVL